MGPGQDRTRDPWICSQTRICCQTRYRLCYAARSLFNDKAENFLKTTVTKDEQEQLEQCIIDKEFSFVVSPGEQKNLRSICALELKCFNHMTEITACNTICKPLVLYGYP